MKMAGRLSDIPNGAAISGSTVTWKKRIDSATVGSDSTDANGLYDLAQDGSPGPMLSTVTFSGQTRERWNVEGMQLGTWFPLEHPWYWEIFPSGVMDNVENEQAVTTDAVTRSVDVATGSALVKGHLGRVSASTNLVIDANVSGSTRIDRVIWRLTRIGQTEEGKLTLTILKGTPGAGAPALTQTAATWEISLSQVSVANGAASFVAGDLTDQRTMIGPLNAGGTMTGPLVITATANGALTVENAAGTDLFNVNTSAGTERVQVVGGADFQVFSDNYVTEKFSIDGATGNAETKGTLTVTTDNALALLVQQVSGTDVFLVDTLGPDVLVSVIGDTFPVFRVRNAALTDIFRVRTDSGFKLVHIPNSADLVFFSDDSTTEKARLFGNSGIFRQGGATGIIHTFGAGSPEGVTTANIGSTYCRTDGGVGTTFYVKSSGTGNTGWSALS